LPHHLTTLRRSSPKLDKRRTDKLSFHGPHLPETGNGLGNLRSGFVIQAVSGVAGCLSQLFGTPDTVTLLRRPARDPWCPTPKGSEDRLDSATLGDF
jgi:hypothetical protein